MFLHISDRFFINREDTVLSASLDRHIGYGKSVIHGKIFDAFSDKLHGFVKCTVYTDHPDDM